MLVWLTLVSLRRYLVASWYSRAPMTIRMGFLKTEVQLVETLDLMN